MLCLLKCFINYRWSVLANDGMMAIEKRRWREQIGATVALCHVAWGSSLRSVRCSKVQFEAGERVGGEAVPSRDVMPAASPRLSQMKSWSDVPMDQLPSRLEFREDAERCVVSYCAMCLRATSRDDLRRQGGFWYAIDLRLWEV